MALVSRPWLSNEIIIAIELYCVTPFGKIHKGNKNIISVAEKLDRTPSSLALKMSNLAALDDSLPRKGMQNFSKLDQQIWNEFFEAVKLASILEPVVAQIADDEETEPVFSTVGADKVSAVRVRIGQSFFRRMVLSSYESQCAISGVQNEQLIVASHIVPWSRNASLRLDPRNGICLNAYIDRAFDTGLVTIDESFTLIFSKKLAGASKAFIGPYEGRKVRMPTKFLPSQDYLAFHRTEIFQK